MRTCPESASTSVDRMRISVDLPEPLAPIKPKMAPRSTSNDTSCTARTCRRGLLDHGRRCPGVKLLLTPRTARGRPGSGTTDGEAVTDEEAVTEGTSGGDIERSSQVGTDGNAHAPGCGRGETAAASGGLRSDGRPLTGRPQET